MLSNWRVINTHTKERRSFQEIWTKKNLKFLIEILFNWNMPKQWCALLLGLFALLLTTVTSSSPRELFTSSFLVRFKRSIDSPLAHEIAKRNGFHNIGEVITIAMLIIHHRAYLIFCHFLHSTINPCILHWFDGKTPHDSSEWFFLGFWLTDFDKI